MWYRFRLNEAQFHGPSTGKYVFMDHLAPPPEPSHVTVTWIENELLLTHGIGRIQYPLHPSSPLQGWYFEWTEKVPTPQQAQIADSIRQNRAIAITNGSYLHSGSAGYCIGDSPLVLWQGACRVPGTIAVQSAYRSELAGIYARLRMCQTICRDHEIHKGSITLACDNLAAGLSLRRKLYYLNPIWDHFDLLQAIFRVVHCLPITVR